MVFVAFRDASGRFRARVPSSWRIDRHPHGATVFSDQRWFEQVSVSVAAVAGPPGATCWRPLLDFPDILHELGGGSLARTWNGVHGASLFVVTHTFPALWGALPRDQVTLLLTTLEFSGAPAPPPALPTLHA